MKSLFFAVAVMSPLLSFAQSNEQFYKAVKYMIVETTAVRIQAVAQNDYAKACNVIKSSAKVDTMTYYVSFEIFESPELRKRFYKEVGPFVARNYESMYRQRLPIALHHACLDKDKLAIRNIINQINGTSMSESVQR